MAKNLWNVDYNYDAEATPREGYVRVVNAPDAETARESVAIWAALNGDRVNIGTVWR